MRRRPDVFIVGAPKTGTSSLHMYLSEHPDVFMSRPKEPGYFAPDVTGTRREQHFRFPVDEAAYLAIFDRAAGAKRAGEASTNYLMSRQAPQLIHRFQPEARIVVMVRNPVDLMYSLHGQRLAGRQEPLADFAGALASDDDRRAGRRLPERLAGFGVAYRDNATLGDQLERWLDVFGRQSVHVIVFDDFAADTPAQYAATLEFLAVDTSFRPSSFEVYRAAYRTRTGLVGGLYRNQLTQWLSRRALPAAVGESTSAALRRTVGMRRVTRQRVERPPLSTELRRRLEDEFTADVEKLGRLIGRDLIAEWFERTKDAAAT